MMNFNNKARIILIAITLCFTSACSQENYRMQKYEPNTQALNDKAIVILGTKNLSFIDFHKYSVSHKIKTADPVAIAVKHNVPVADASVKTENYTHSSSGDPNDVAYPKVKFSELFKRSTRTQQTAVIDTKEETSKPKASQPSSNYLAEAADTYRVLKAPKFLNTGYSKSIYTIEPGTYYISYAYCNDDNDERFTKLPGLTADGAVEYGAFVVKPGDVVYLGDIEVDWLRPSSDKMFVVGGDLNAVKKDLLSANYNDIVSKLKMATYLPRGSRIQL